MSSAGFEPAIPVIKQLHTYALDRTVTGIRLHAVPLPTMEQKSAAIAFRFKTASVRAMPVLTLA
jgi:hypothetical protein